MARAVIVAIILSSQVARETWHTGCVSYTLHLAMACCAQGTISAQGKAAALMGAMGAQRAIWPVDSDVGGQAGTKLCSGQGGMAHCWCQCLLQGWVPAPGLRSLQLTRGAPVWQG